MGRVKAVFISLLVRRDRRLTPDTAAESNHDEKIMRSSQVYGDSEQSVEKLKQQWTHFMSETLLAITAEEMRIWREELKRRNGSPN
jgi:hypothetical protein